ncbi:hypothetical protein BN2537_8573 [Streptomyces venezuelae]|nr:hypothetical protein BN2537_8573 [Streptomyces venezuelae]
MGGHAWLRVLSPAFPTARQTAVRRSCAFAPHPLHTDRTDTLRCARPTPPMAP